jgi:hypothetical protein
MPSMNTTTQTQPELIKPENQVPVRFAGMEMDGFRIVTASDMMAAASAIVFAKVTGSVGSKSFDHGPAGEIERWAIVERVNQPA